MAEFAADDEAGFAVEHFFLCAELRGWLPPWIRACTDSPYFQESMPRLFPPKIVGNGGNALFMRVSGLVLR
jgi:hypothetical protein